MSLYICPHCGQPLERESNSYRCQNGHCYDISSAGYVHLLPVEQKHSKLPGDDKGMARARKKFLSGGYYSHLSEQLQDLALRYTGEAPVIIDSGCGEGYYTAGIFHRLTAAGKEPKMAGVDLSKFSLRWAAKREAAVEFAVASAYRLPVAEETADLLLNCFSPLALAEFRRVLKPEGVFLYVVPGPRHLWELKEVLYETPYQNKEERIVYDGFRYQEVCRVERRIHLPDQETLQSLFQMTPYYWKTPAEGKRRLDGLSELDVQTEFDIHVFARQSETASDVRHPCMQGRVI